MEYRNLGNSGLKVSVLGLGYSFTGIDKSVYTSSDYEQLKFEQMSACINLGINYFDTAEYYGSGYSEELLGRNLKQGGWDRDDLIISSKLHPITVKTMGLSRKRIRSATAKCLERLQLDTIDLLFFHRHDYDTPLLEQISAMNDLIENDLIYYWGTSEYPADELEEIHYLCEKHGFVPPIADQCCYNMLTRNTLEVDYAPLVDKYKMGTVVYSPAAGGALSGKFNNGLIPEGSKYLKAFWLKDEYQEKLAWRENNGAEMLKGLKKIADKLGCSQNQLALAWTLYNPDVSTMLFGASRVDQISDNVEAIKIVQKLDQNTLERIEDLLINRPTPPIDNRTFTPRPPRR